MGLGVPEMSASWTSPSQSVGPCTFLEEGGASESPWTLFLPPARVEHTRKERRTDPGGGGETKAGFPATKHHRDGDAYGNSRGIDLSRGKFPFSIFRCGA